MGFAVTGEVFATTAEVIATVVEGFATVVKGFAMAAEGYAANADVNAFSQAKPIKPHMVAMKLGNNTHMNANMSPYITTADI